MTTTAEEGEAKEEAANEAKALWTRPRTEISDDEYQEFYRHVSHDFQEPLTWSHNKVEGKREYTSLLYVPARAPWDLWNRSGSRGLKLYVKRVFIMDDAEQFLPLYLRFIRGVVDSGDLSLNVSRELLQQDAVVESMKSALTKRVLDMLEKLAKDDPEKYATFWKEFGRVLKEGPAEDHANREKIAGLLRFSTTHNDSADAGPVPRRLHRPAPGCGPGRPEGHLVPDRRQLQCREVQSAPGSVPQAGHRGAAAHGHDRRVADRPPGRVRRPRVPGREARRAGAGCGGRGQGRGAEARRGRARRR